MRPLIIFFATSVIVFSGLMFAQDKAVQSRKNGVSDRRFARAYSDKPVLKNRPPITIPDSLQPLKKDVTVWVRMLVDDSGRVKRSQIIKSSDERFNADAIEWTKECQFDLSTCSIKKETWVPVPIVLKAPAASASADSAAQNRDEPLHEEWVRDDSTFISKWIAAALQTPGKITRYSPVSHRPYELDTLGFGYTYYEGSSGKGYVSCFYSLLFYKGKLVSYQLRPQMPPEDRLLERYRSFYAPLFSFSDDGREVYPFRWNDSLVQRPLEDAGFQMKPTAESDPDLLDVMTPYIGIEYGDRGGWSGAKLSSRCAFECIRRKLTSSNIVNLLHSINPATRLMALEYLLSHKEQFAIDMNMVLHDASIIYRKCPRVKTFQGCNIDRKDARELVKWFVDHPVE